MHDYDKTGEQNSVRSGKSEAELALDVVLLKLMTDTKHRAASLRQQSYWYIIIIIIIIIITFVYQQLSYATEQYIAVKNE